MSSHFLKHSQSVTFYTSYIYYESVCVQIFRMSVVHCLEGLEYVV